MLFLRYKCRMSKFSVRVVRQEYVMHELGTTRTRSSECEVFGYTLNLQAKSRNEMDQITVEKYFPVESLNDVP